MTHLDKNKEYSLKEVLSIVNDYNAYKEAYITLTISTALSCGLGGAVYYASQLLLPTMLFTALIPTAGVAASLIVTAITSLAGGYESSDSGAKKFPTIDTPIENFDLYEHNKTSFLDAYRMISGNTPFKVLSWNLSRREYDDNILEIKKHNFFDGIKVKVKDAKYTGAEIESFLNDAAKLNTINFYSYPGEKYQLVSKLLSHGYDDACLVESDGGSQDLLS